MKTGWSAEKFFALLSHHNSQWALYLKNYFPSFEVIVLNLSWAHLQVSLCHFQHGVDNDKGKKALLVAISFFLEHPPQRCPVMSPLLFIRCLSKLFSPNICLILSVFGHFKDTFYKLKISRWEEIQFPVFSASKAKGHISWEFRELKSQDSRETQSERWLYLRVLFPMLPLICCHNHFSIRSLHITLSTE